MKEVDDLLITVYDVCSRTATICFAHPSTLLKLNMRDFYADTYFISDLNCEENKVLLVKDKQLKKKYIYFVLIIKIGCFKEKRRTKKGDIDYE